MLICFDLIRSDDELGQALLLMKLNLAENRQ